MSRLEALSRKFLKSDHRLVFTDVTFAKNSAYQCYFITGVFLPFPLSKPKDTWGLPPQNFVEFPRAPGSTTSNKPVFCLNEQSIFLPCFDLIFLKKKKKKKKKKIKIIFF